MAKNDAILTAPEGGPAAGSPVSRIHSSHMSWARFASFAFVGGLGVVFSLAVVALLHELMPAAGELSVPLKVEIGTGPNWDQAH